jgi:anti-anti-sigma factor
MDAWVVRIPKQRATIGGVTRVVILHVAEDGTETELEVLTYSNPSSPFSALEAQAAKGRKNLILDLSFVSALDSLGLGELISAFTEVRRLSGSLVLTGLSPKVKDAFRITGLDRAFLSFDFVSEAVDHYYSR